MKKSRPQKSIEFIPIRTKILHPPQDSLYPVLDESLPALAEGDLVLITSKALAIHQGRCVPIDSVKNKDRLIAHEAEAMIPRSRVPGQVATITLKGSTLIPAAGIDESNGDGYYVLWPENIQNLLKEIWSRLRKKNAIRNLGVIATDSHTTPLRYGVIGISIGAFGVIPLADYRRRPDIFGRALKFTQANIIDSLAATGVLLMGESNEQCPLLIIRNVPGVRFSPRNHWNDLIIPPDQDIYRPLLDRFKRTHHDHHMHRRSNA